MEVPEKKICFEFNILRSAPPSKATALKELLRESLAPRCRPRYRVATDVERGWLAQR